MEMDDKKKSAKLHSYKQARLKDWVVKASSTDLGTYFVMMFNEKNDDCITGFFNTKAECEIFIAMVLDYSGTVI